ncbi:histidine phosphatase family protein [Conyzicola nivalis]|uniref:Phosphoglycerate mutase n=1 Tax=Conyzicola nivalis TaxID=1477021 RepID=A0A916SEX9_9MICO|nr:histidine phosphatase family protein [Conyzicola nivalis]GGA95775.1 phosphoglycerate mutase [Conyzicola nivalis]
MTTIYLVRHGETDWNRARRIQGSTDIPLNQTGRDQAAVTGALLASRQWDGVYASPLARAYETGAIIADQLGLPAPEAVPEVAERRYGEAEGLTGDEIDARFPGDTPVPGRESREEVAARVIPAIVALAERHPGENIVLVSHGGVIRTILGVVAPDEHPEPIRNGSVHSFRHTDGTLDLIAFDDPIEVQSLACATDDIEDQNAVESRDSLV